MIYRDLVKQAATVSGTGAFTLGAAVSGFQTMEAGRVVGDQIEYAFRKGVEWENGLGTLAAGGTLTRAPSASSNAGALVVFAAGAGEIIETVTGSRLTVLDRNSSARVYVLSRMGVASDADLAAGSATFGVDSTAAVQAILDLSSDANPIRVVWDVKCSGTGWKIKSGTTIEAVGNCGAILRTTSNKSLFENANIRFTPGTRIDKNITIKGGIWNGNRGVASGNNGKGTGTTGLNCIFRFYGVDTLTFDPDLLICSPSYSSHVMNCKRVYSTRTKHDVGPSHVINNDGHNTGGYCEDVVYRDLHINGFDDPLSISPDDVWGITGSFVYPFYPVTSMGPIKNVLVDNLYLNSLIYGVRLMAPLSRLDNVVIRNITGTTTAHAVLLDNYMAEGGLPSAVGNGNIGTVHIDGIDVAVTGTAVIRIKSSIEKLKISNMRRNSFGDAIPSILIDGTGVTMQSLEIVGYDSYDAAGNMVVPHIKMVGGTIKELRINGARIRRGGAANGSVLLQLTAGATVESLQVSDISLTNITNLLSVAAGCTVNQINGTNISQSGGSASFLTAAAIPRINVSGYIGVTVTSGTFTQTSGDAFVVVADVVAPTAGTAAVANATPTVVRLTMSEAMSETNVPATTAFAVSGHAVSLVAISGVYIDLTVSVAFAFGEAAQTVAYTQPGGTGNARDLAGNLLANFTAKAITNNLVDATNYATGATAVGLAGDAFLVDTAGVKSLTGSAATASVYQRYAGAGSTVKLPSATNGWVGLKYQGPAQYDTVTGFNLSITATGTDKPIVGFTFVAGRVAPIESGAGATANGGQTLEAPIVGNIYALRATGSVITIQRTGDGGTTWTTIYTFVPTRTTDLYVYAGLYNAQTSPYMQGVGLTA